MKYMTFACFNLFKWLIYGHSEKHHVFSESMYSISLTYNAWKTQSRTEAGFLPKQYCELIDFIAGFKNSFTYNEARIRKWKQEFEALNFFG